MCRTRIRPTCEFAIQCVVSDVKKIYMHSFGEKLSQSQLRFKILLKALSPLLSSISTLLISSPPPPSLLSSLVPSLCSSSPLWPLVVWDVWSLGPALLTRLSETFSFHACPFHWAKSAPFSQSLPAKPILWLGYWWTDPRRWVCPRGPTASQRPANGRQTYLVTSRGKWPSASQLQMFNRFARRLGLAY